MFKFTKLLFVNILEHNQLSQNSPKYNEKYVRTLLDGIVFTFGFGGGTVD